MELFVFGRDRKLAGVVESFEYLRWTRRYFACGGFELHAIATPENIKLLQIGNYLWKNDDEEAGIIEYTEMIAEEQESVIVRGRFATSLLHRRIVWGTEILHGDLAAAMDQLLTRHLIRPSDPARAVGGIDFIMEETGAPVNTQVSYRNLLDVAEKLCEASDVGIKTVFCPQSGRFTVRLYRGAPSLAVFSKEYENLIGQVFIRSAADYANTALIGGEGEGAERVFADIDGGSGEDRYEIFVDAKDLRMEDFGDDYAPALLFRGDSKLNEKALVQTFDAVINQYGNLVYKADFDLGQEVHVISKKWGVLLKARITEIEESYDGEGRSVSAVFGKGMLSLLRKLKGVM